MASFNKVILAGNLTRDPELSYLPSQTPVVDFGLAVNNRYRTRDGEQREDVCFIDCRCFGRQAETINQYMRKGRPILIEGRLDLDTWQAQDGSRRSKHRVTVERFTFIDSGGGGSQGGGPGGSGRYGNQQEGGGGYQRQQRPGGPQRNTGPRRDYEQPQQEHQQPQSNQGDDVPPDFEEFDGEDIPF